MKNNIITIESYHFWSDWTSTETTEINLNEIIGFKLHWRMGDWHVEVVTREKKGDYEYKSYELHHGVHPVPLATAISDQRFKMRIISIETNSMGLGFYKAIKNIMDMADKTEIDNSK